MKTLIIIILLNTFIFSNTNVILNPIFIYQEYVIKQKQQKERKKTIITYIITAPITTFFLILGINSVKKPHRK